MPQYSNSPKNDADFQEAVAQGRISTVQAGTKINPLTELWAENGKIEKPYATTSAEMQRRGIIGVVRAMVQEGPLTGKAICLPDSSRIDTGASAVP